jgi:hypothetical protein
MPQLVDASAGAHEVSPAVARPAGRLTEPGTGRAPGPAERITVALVPTAAGHLRQLQERTSMSKTDITNRAITSYEFFEAHMQSGHELLVRDAATGETQLVRFL